MSRTAEGIVAYGFEVLRTEDEEYEDDGPEHELAEWFQDQGYAALCDAQKRYNCDVIPIGYSDLPGYIVAATETVQRVAWRDVTGLDVERMDRVRGLGDADERLRQFCQALGLKYHEPDWILASRYG
jgi:hypothetical protein